MQSELMVYVINLPHRADRAQESLVEAKRIPFQDLNVRILQACHTPYNGYIGNAVSHANAVMEFVRVSVENPKGKLRYALILEDDFSIHNPAALSDAIRFIESGNQNWNVVLLAGNLIKCGREIAKGVRPCFSSQTASAYLINFEFAFEFVSLALEAGILYSKFFSSKEILEANDIYALDQWWKRSQARGGWFVTVPTASHQRRSFSDVQGKVVEYGC